VDGELVGAGSVKNIIKKNQTLESPHWILGRFISSSESMPRGRANFHMPTWTIEIQAELRTWSPLE
jgi:hypothetical protein